MTIPGHLRDRPELVAAVLDARHVQMETEDTAFAIEWLTEHSEVSFAAASKILEDETFRYASLYPDGHPGLESIKAENRAKHRRSYNRRKLRPAILERDGSRCRNCKKRVWGRDAQLDHADPEGPETLDNLLLLCQRCNVIKGRRTWEVFQESQREWERQLKAKQDARPDIRCSKTGLSIKGRSWQEAGCTNPSWCLTIGECSPDQDSVLECPCHHYGCEPDCSGCRLCEHDENTVPKNLICDIGMVCQSPVVCRTARACQTYGTGK